MDEPTIVTNWSLGIDNRNPRGELPPGTVRDLVNMDAGAELNLRTGYAGIYAGDDIRGVVGFKSKLLIANGTDLIEHDLLTNSNTVLRTITAQGGLVGTVLNEELFLCVGNENLRYDGQTLRQWGVPAVGTQPVATTVTGNTPAGTYLVAVTHVDAYGVEGGTCAARAVVVPEGRSISLSGIPAAPAGGFNRVYLSGPNSTTLYLFAETTESTLVMYGPSDVGNRTLETQFEVPPMYGHAVATSKGVIAIASDSTLWVTRPLRPHALSRRSGFFSYPSRVNMVIGVKDGFYIGADKTYFLSNVELEPRQNAVYDAPVVAGSAATLKDGSVVWLTREGYMRGTETGATELVSKDRFVPQLASQGASGVVAVDGRQMVVTTMRGVPTSNTLGASDFFQSEIIRS